MTTDVSPQQAEANRTITLTVYILHAASLVSGGIASLIAVIVNYVKRDDVVGTMYESHFTLADPHVLVQPAVGRDGLGDGVDPDRIPGVGRRLSVVHLPDREGLDTAHRRQADVRGLRAIKSNGFALSIYKSRHAAWRWACGTHQPWIWLKIRNGMRTVASGPSARRCASRISRSLRFFERSMRDADEIAVTLGRARRARHEAAFLQSPTSAPAKYDLRPPAARDRSASRCSWAAWARRQAWIERLRVVEAAHEAHRIRHGVVAIVLARQHPGVRDTALPSRSRDARPARDPPTGA